MSPVDSEGPVTPGAGDGVGGGPILSRYDPADGEVCVAVAEAVADALDSRPEELEPLSTYVDPDALDALVGTRRGVTPHSTSASFVYLGCAVTVTSWGQITVDPDAL